MLREGCVYAEMTSLRKNDNAEMSKEEEEKSLINAGQCFKRHVDFPPLLWLYKCPNLSRGAEFVLQSRLFPLMHRGSFRVSDYSFFFLLSLSVWIEVHAVLCCGTDSLAVITFGSLLPLTWLVREGGQ